MATETQQVWFNSKLYRISAETVQVQAQRGATLYWTNIKDKSLAARIRAYIASK